MQKASMVNSRYSGLTPNEKGRPYTSPAVKFDSSTYLQDSAKIAPELEKRYPEPPLHLDSPLLPKAYAAVGAILEVIRPMLMRKVLPNLLNERSVDYISHTRAEALRKSREEYSKGSVVEEVWRKLEVPLKNLAALTRGNGGPFVMGKIRKLFLLPLSVLKGYTVVIKGG
jgi:glutathione S-transferase